MLSISVFNPLVTLSTTSLLPNVSASTLPIEFAATVLELMFLPSASNTVSRSRFSTKSESACWKVSSSDKFSENFEIAFNSNTREPDRFSASVSQFIASIKDAKNPYSALPISSPSFWSRIAFHVMSIAVISLPRASPSELINSASPMVSLIALPIAVPNCLNASNIPFSPSQLSVFKKEITLFLNSITNFVMLSRICPQSVASKKPLIIEAKPPPQSTLLFSSRPLTNADTTFTVLPSVLPASVQIVLSPRTPLKNVMILFPMLYAVSLNSSRFF